jgi:isoleucyl-tRNA synthetase
MLEIDRYALARAAQLQAEIAGVRNQQTGMFEGGCFGRYEFHPVVTRLQIYCSEDLGAFYLDVLKDRLYTTAPESLARRSAQTALWQITQAMLRWMAPFLSFTAEEAWGVIGTSESIFLETYVSMEAPDTALVAKWDRIREIRDVANKEIEVLRAGGLVGSPLQAELTIQVNPSDAALLESLEDDLKYVFITSDVRLTTIGDELGVAVAKAHETKCARCWHYPTFPHHVGSETEHPTICPRCVSNLYGAGETRHFA